MNAKKTKSIWAVLIAIIAIVLVMIISVSMCMGVFFVKASIKKACTAEGVLCVSFMEGREEGSVEQEATTNSVKYALTSRGFFEKVSEDIGGKYTGEEIKDMTTVTSGEKTGLIKVSVTAEEPMDAYIVAEAFINNAPEHIEHMMGNVKVSVVDEPNLPNKEM